MDANYAKMMSSVLSARWSPVRFPTPDCGLKRPCLMLLGVRPFRTRAGWMMILAGGAVEVPLPPIVGNGMADNLVINKGVRDGKAAPHPKLLPWVRHHSAGRRLAESTIAP